MRTRLLTVALGCALTVVAGCSSSHPKAVPFEDYVALGDSYSAGPLIPPTAEDSPQLCLRSASNYPSYLASYLKVKSFADASCAGAQTADLHSSQSKRMGLKPDDATDTPRQFDALRKTTDLVTLGIGGNDFGLFENLLPVSVGRQDIASRLARASQVQPRVERAITEIRKRAPGAKVVVVGYLRVFPESGNCSTLSISGEDRVQADSIQRRINQSLADAAEETGVTFIDSYAHGTGHDVCAGERAWVNGSRNSIFVAAAFHPLRQGMNAVAREIYRTVTDKNPPRTPDAEALDDVPR